MQAILQPPQACQHLVELVGPQVLQRRNALVLQGAVHFTLPPVPGGNVLNLDLCAGAPEMNCNGGWLYSPFVPRRSRDRVPQDRPQPTYQLTLLLHSLPLW